jgi:hypothetical protein
VFAGVLADPEALGSTCLPGVLRTSPRRLGEADFVAWLRRRDCAGDRSVAPPGIDHRGLCRALLGLRRSAATADWTSIWAAVANFAIKAAGPVLLGGRELPRPVVAVIALLGPALLMALVVVGTFSDGSSLRVDAQAAGVAVAGGAFLFRVPMLAGIALGALTAALLRLAA